MGDEWQGREVLVLGLGETGLSCVRWLARHGARLSAADTRASPPALGALGREHPQLRIALGPFDEALLEGVDSVVASPGLALREPVLRAAVARGIEVLGDVEVYARALARDAKGVRVLGVTGTNGKSTVPALAALSAAEANGYPDLYAVELSSYQLETTSSLALDAATMLNLTQDHLDRYDTLSDYARAKERIFRHCGRRVVNRDDPWSAAMGDADAFSFGLGEPVDELQWGLDADRATL